MPVRVSVQAGNGQNKRRTRELDHLQGLPPMRWGPIPRRGYGRGVPDVPPLRIRCLPAERVEADRDVPAGALSDRRGCGRRLLAFTTGHLAPRPWATSGWSLATCRFWLPILAEGAWGRVDWPGMCLCVGLAAYSLRRRSSRRCPRDGPTTAMFSLSSTRTSFATRWTSSTVTALTPVTTSSGSRILPVRSS